MRASHRTDYFLIELVHHQPLVGGPGGVEARLRQQLGDAALAEALAVVGELWDDVNGTALGEALGGRAC